MTILKPNIEFDENLIPINRDFGDSYYSKSGGLDETKEVFINACGLSEKFANQDNVIIGELGFGTGLNFLVVYDLWRKLKRKNGVLHFYTFEKFLMPRETAQIALSKWPEIKDLANELIENWPIHKTGSERIWFNDNIALNIIIGDANETILKQNFKADAWFLDGFAPRTNQDLWNIELFSHLKRLCKPNARLGTYSVAQIVRNSLEVNGFQFQKCKGFGSKRERLEAWLDGEEHIHQPPNSCVIIGNGIAGSALAHSLLKRNFDVTIIEDDAIGAIKASNNKAGLFMPKLDRLDDEYSRFYKEAYIYSWRQYKKLENCYEEIGVQEFARNDRDFEKFAIFKTNPPLPNDFLNIENDYLNHKKGGIIWPQNTCKALSNGAKFIDAKVLKIEKSQNNSWLVIGNNDEIIKESQLVFIANGAGIANLEIAQNLEVTGRMGQVSIANKKIDNSNPISSGGYFIPLNDGFLIGATFDRVGLNNPLEITHDAHKKNIEIIEKFAPNLAQEIDINKLYGRTSMRVVTKDKMPIAGKLEENLYVLSALGSRGFSISLLLAEHLISEIMGEPSPLSQFIIDKISISK